MAAVDDVSIRPTLFEVKQILFDFRNFCLQIFHVENISRTLFFKLLRKIIIIETREKLENNNEAINAM